MTSHKNTILIIKFPGRNETCKLNSPSKLYPLNSSRKQMARSNWAIEKSLIKELFTPVETGYRETRMDNVLGLSRGST